MKLIDQLCTTEEGLRLFQQEATGLEATEAICRVMDRLGWTRKRLDEYLSEVCGWERAHLYQLLDDGAAMTIRELADIFTALGRSAIIVYEKMSPPLPSAAHPLTGEEA